jgi:4-amino-4-deoxy-L-arabinose transferase-like glycosyltransferase
MNRCELSSRRFALSKLAAQWAVSPLGIAALGLIAIFVRLPQLSAHVFVFDEAIYFMASRSVAEHGYVWANMRAIGHAHPPAFFVLQASWFRLAERLGVNVPIETLHRLPSVVLAGLTTALTYLLGVNIDRLTGWLAAVVFALHPLFVAYTRLGVLESLLLFSCVLTLNLYLWALKSDERRRRFLLSLSGLAMSVAILTKVYAVILVPVLVLHRAIMTIGDRHRTKLLWMSRGCLAELAVFGTAVVGGLLLFSTIWANDPLLLYRIWTTAYGWTSGVNRGRLWVYDSLLSHLGFIIVIFAGQGLAIVALQPFTSGFVKRATALYEPVPLREYLRHLIFPLIILAWGSAFSLYTSTQFDRYLVPLALIISLRHSSW